MLREAVPVAVGLKQAGGQVVPRCAPPLGRERFAYANISGAAGLENGRCGIAREVGLACDELAGMIRVGVPEHPVSELDEVAPVLKRHADQLAEDPHRQLDSDGVHEVELRLGERLIEDLAEQRADPILVVVDDAQQERSVDDVAQPPMLGRIAVEHRHP